MWVKGQMFTTVKPNHIAQVIKEVVLQSSKIKKRNGCQTLKMFKIKQL